jgi:hypothetical protein
MTTLEADMPATETTPHRRTDERRGLGDPAWRRDMVTILIGAWLVAAVFSDGWAHLNVPELESFFTPWHGALYSGFVAMAAWVTLLAWQGRRPGTPPFAWLPRGYRAAAIGVIVFGLGGIADLTWHEAFGVEVAVDALVSPSHLLLGAGGLLILTSPLRAQGVLSSVSGERRGGWTLPALWSLVLTTALVTFFLLYTSPFPMPALVETFVPTPEGTPGHEEAELPVIAALGAYLVTTAVFTVPLLLMLHSRAGLPRGGVTLLIGTIAWLSVAVLDFPPIAMAGALGATLGAAVADIALTRLRTSPRGRPLPAPVLAAVTAVLVWSGQLTGLAAADALRWPVSLWSGVVVLTGFAAVALGLLVSSPAD